MSWSRVPMMCWSNLTSTKRYSELLRLLQQEVICAPILQPERQATKPRQHAPPTQRSWNEKLKAAVPKAAIGTAPRLSEKVQSRSCRSTASRLRLEPHVTKPEAG